MAHVRFSQDCKSTSQSRTVSSALAEARRVPSGLKATLITQLSCPVSGGPMGWPLAASQSRTDGERGHEDGEDPVEGDQDQAELPRRAHGHVVAHEDHVVL